MMRPARALLPLLLLPVLLTGCDADKSGGAAADSAALEAAAGDWGVAPELVYVTKVSGYTVFQGLVGEYNDEFAAGGRGVVILRGGTAAASAAAVTAAAAGARTAAGSGREARQREHDDYCHRRELQSARPCLLAHERSPHSAVRDRPVSLQVPPRAAKASSSTEPSITLTLRTSDSPAGTDRMAPPSVVATCLPSASVNLTSNL